MFHIPFQGCIESGIERILRLKPEVFPGTMNIGKGFSDVSRTARCKFRFDVDGQSIPDGFPQVQNA